VYGTTSVDSAVACLNAAVQDAMKHAITRGVINANSKVPHWSSSTLKYYIRKNNFTDVLKKIKMTLFTNNFLSIVSQLRLLLSLTDLDGLNL
jgi:hypothetical protein